MRSSLCLFTTASITLVSFCANAQTLQNESSPLSNRTTSALVRHRAVLANYFAAKRTFQDESSDFDSRGIESSQFASPVEFDTSKSLSGAGGYYYSTKSGRDLEIGEWTLGYRPNAKLGLWYSNLAVAAKGRTRPIRPTFNAEATRFGLRYQLKGDERSGWSLQYDRVDNGTAFVTDSTSSATLPGPKTDIFNLIYHFRRHSTYQDPPALPGFRMRLHYSNLKGAGAGAEEYGAGLGSTFKVARSLYGDADATVFGEARNGSTTAKNLRLHLSGGMTFQPAKWVKLQAGLDVFPGGVPLGGSPLTSISSYGVYQRNDGVSGISSGTVAVLNVRLVVGKRF